MRLVVLACAVSFFLGGAASAGGNDSYALGKACFERLNFSCAIELLTAAARACPPEDKARLADIYRKLAESQLALGRRSQAVADFVRLLKAVPGYRLKETGVSPKILDAFSEARAEIDKAEASRLKALKPVRGNSQPTRPAGPPSVELGLSAGVEVLVGEDRRLLDVGPAFDLECDFPVGGRWRVGAGLRYTYHGRSSGGDGLQLGGGWASAGLDWRLGLVVIAARAGLGAVYFGIPGDEGRAGLWLPLRLGLNFDLGRGVWLGLLAAPAWIVTFNDGVKSSFTMVAGGRLLLTF